MTTTDDSKSGTPSHVVVDWGTSSFRLWALGRDGKVLAERRSNQGFVTQGLSASMPGSFEAVLESHLDALGIGVGVPVMMCGMVGSRTGWVEAAYLSAPVPLGQLTALSTPVPAALRPVRVLPGLAQPETAHPDVMRGEETQLLGLAAEQSNGVGYSGLVCLPGTHSKWVVLEQGTVRRFATFMTGELFQLLRSQSVLVQALEGAAAVDAASSVFAEGVAEGLQRPESIGNSLFALRAGWLLNGTDATDTLARLSGLLIGAELAGARRLMERLAGVTLVASGPAAALYSHALAIAGVANVQVRDAEACGRAGLHAAACHAFTSHAVFEQEGHLS